MDVTFFNVTLIVLAALSSALVLVWMLWDRRDMPEIPSVWMALVAFALAGFWLHALTHVPGGPYGPLVFWCVVSATVGGTSLVAVCLLIANRIEWRRTLRR